MLKQGLKIQISMTLAILLLLSMILINVVATFFWQRSLIQGEIGHIERSVQLWNDTPEAIGVKYSSSSESMRRLQTAIGESCLGVVVYDGNELHGGIDEIHFDISLPLKQGYEERRAFVNLVGLSWKTFSFGGQYLISVHPFMGNDGPPYSLAIVVDLEKIYEQVRSKQPVLMVYILLNALILSTIGFFRMAKHVLRPIDKLINISESYTNANELIFVTSKDEDEFGKLSFALNSMLGKIHADKQELKKHISSLESANELLKETEGKVIRAEKLAAVGRLSAGLAHEIGNPLGIVLGYLDLLKKDDLSLEERSQFSGRASKELERVNKMIRQLLDYSRTPAGKPGSVSVSEVCNEALQAILIQESVVKIEFSTDFYGGPDTVALSFDDLYQVLINCLFNAVDALKDRGSGFSGKVFLSTECIQSSDKRQEIKITLRDNGEGIHETTLNSVFDPFFTTKDVGQGTGLGLSVSFAIIDAANGGMDIESEVGKGSIVTITLPLL